LLFGLLGAVALAACAIIPGETRAEVRAEVFRSFQVDKVLVLKGKRRMHLLRRGMVLRTYEISLGRAPTGQKVKQGDGKTPEGWYILDSRNPGSKFHRSIRVSYPNEADRARARAMGVPPGGAIMIHGEPNHLQDIGFSGQGWDWTEGCIAVTNREIEEIWNSVPDGTPIEIRP
jgi:murein L,D-transpeptidase YafK